jgi:hypothetical protein
MKKTAHIRQDPTVSSMMIMLQVCDIRLRMMPFLWDNDNLIVDASCLSPRQLDRSILHQRQSAFCAGDISVDPSRHRRQDFGPTACSRQSHTDLILFCVPWCCVFPVQHSSMVAPTVWTITTTTMTNNSRPSACHAGVLLWMSAPRLVVA